MSLNQLGNFYFLSIHTGGDSGGPPELTRTILEMVQRPGYPGTAFIDLHKKGKPFQMRSVVDVESFGVGVYLAAQYQEAQGKQALGLVWGGINSVSEFQTVYIPIEVIPSKVRRIRSAVGGLFPPSLALVECMWTLVPVDLPQP